MGLRNGKATFFFLVLAFHHILLAAVVGIVSVCFARSVYVECSRVSGEHVNKYFWHSTESALFFKHIEISQFVHFTNCTTECYNNTSDSGVCSHRI